MSQWSVEIDNDLLSDVTTWSRDQQKELYAIQLRLRGGGPEAMGLIKAELEGVPDWKDMSGSLSLRLPVSLRSGWKDLVLEIQANFRIVVVSLE